MAISGELITCKKGHYYDPEKHTGCPTCKKEQGAKDAGYTRGKSEEASKTNGGIRYVEHSRDYQEQEDADITVSGAMKSFGFEPIVGWLVCTEGTFKGKDYSIRMGRNYIGRDSGMDVCIKDSTVSRTNHASVSYDDKSNKYYYTPGMSRSIDHINEEPVFATVELKARDTIEIGSSKMTFVPLCNSRFKWEDWNEEE